MKEKTFANNQARPKNNGSIAIKIPMAVPIDVFLSAKPTNGITIITNRKIHPDETKCQK